jgi:hypothetical protein
MHLLNRDYTVLTKEPIFLVSKRQIQFSESGGVLMLYILNSTKEGAESKKNRGLKTSQIIVLTALSFFGISR